MRGLTRYPQVPKGPQVAYGDREAHMAAHLPLKDVEEAREVIARDFGITFERDSPSDTGDVYCGRRCDDRIFLYVNSEDENRQRYRRLPARAIVLEIETKVARCREYERMIRTCFQSLPGRIKRIYLLRAFTARAGNEKSRKPRDQGRNGT